MPGEISASDLLTREFAPSLRERQRWRHLMNWSQSDRTFKLLKRIEAAQPKLQSGDGRRDAWLLPYRNELRWVIQFSFVEPIKLYVYSCPLEMLPLGVWLWGKCADRFRLYGLSAFCHHPSSKVRKHVVKALWRLEAWALIDEIAAYYPDDENIQWYAKAPTTHRPFAERLKRFTSSVDRSRADDVATPSKMPFWAQESTWERTPPKSVEFIRRMLRRIRHWVRWGAASRGGIEGGNTNWR
jgi:hypothetical protein